MKLFISLSLPFQHNSISREINQLILPIILENALQISSGIIAAAMVGRLLLSDILRAAGYNNVPMYIAFGGIWVNPNSTISVSGLSVSLVYTLYMGCNCTRPDLKIYNELPLYRKNVKWHH